MPEKCECVVPRYPERCNIQQDSSAAGNPTPNYSGTAYKTNVPCWFIPTAGDETYRGRQLEAHIVGVVRMPYISGVLPTMRLQMTSGINRGRIMNISEVRPVQKTGAVPTLEIYCKELTEV